MLVVFAGLPGTGKTAVSRRVADQLGATFLRIDTLEAAINSTFAPIGDNPVGYVTAARIAADQLHSARTVVLDAVNDIELARQMWIELAGECGVPLRFVEVICTDPFEHRRRVESRAAEMPGHTQPTWEQVQQRAWEPFTAPRFVVDNLGNLDGHVHAVLAWLRAEPQLPSRR